MQQTTKQEIRERILTLLRNQKEEERLAKSLIIESKLFKLQEIQSAKTILFYFSFTGEVNTLEMIKQAQTEGKTIGIPRVRKEDNSFQAVPIQSIEQDLEKGPYGIKQPKAALTEDLKVDQLDAVIVPGVAFDKSNYRLGRGGGHYDRFLEKLPPRTPTIGLAFDFQIIDSLPEKQNHDIPVEIVLTN